MKPGVPWSVKGIEPDVREAAKVAARRSGMTLGEWLNSKILETADDIPDTRPDPYARSAVAPSHALERTASRLEDIAEQLSRLSRRDSETAQRVAGPLEQRLAPDNEALHKILSRVDSNERQTVEAFTAVNDRLSVLGRQITQAGKREARVEESPGYVALEKAVRNIVEHMESSEKRTRDNFKSLHDRMASLSQKASTSPQDSVSKQAPTFTHLESRLADLAKRVERSESGTAQNTLPDLLKTELTELANRIDTVRETAESLAMRAQTQAVQTSQQELRAIEGRIVGLVKEAQASLGGTGAGPAEMQRLRGEVERLNARIDEAHKAQANGGDVMALRAAVEQLSTRVAQGADMRPLADMDRRILDITQRLEQQQSQTRSSPQVSELERRMAELDYKLSEAVADRGGSHASEIEERLGEIATRVGRTEAQLGSLETIERAVNQLFDSMEQQRNWTQEVADGAANRMAQQVMSAVPAPTSLSGAPEIQALQDGLQAVREASDYAEGRNQETLEAVHETLEQIVTKLAELETAAIGQRVAAAAAAPMVMEAVAQPAVFAEAPAPAQDWSQPANVQSPVDNPFAPVAAPIMDPLQEQPEAPVMNPFEAIMQRSGHVADTPKQPGLGDGDDFIAAARRAAQVSVQSKSMLSGLSPGAARASEEASKKLLGGFLKRRKRTASSPQAAAPLNGELKHPPGLKAANTNDTRKRKYIIMGIALLAAVSVFTFNMLGQAKKATSSAQPAAIEQQLESATPVPQPNAATPAPAPDASKAKPPQPKPAEIQSMLLPDGGDPLLTGSVEPPAADALTSIVAGTAAADDAMAPAATGSLQLREAAALGNAEAQFVIATRYLNGENGLKQDFAKAAYWYGKSAAAGNAPGQYRLGTLYERGKGVARDMNAALGWYERAASLGNVKAMHNAAVLSANNDQKKPDYAKAFKWFSLGAAHGLKDSQFNLAVLLERGLGTKVNAKEALFWYSMAAKQNDADANKRAGVLAKTMSSADLQSTEQQLREWKPETAPDAANTVAVTDPAWKADSPDAS
jgi:localization factor PodJL